MTQLRRIPASFRDPAGFLFRRDSILYRQVNTAGMDDYRRFMSSGLYAKLTDSGQLIEHEEIDPEGLDEHCQALLRPHVIPFISYPYEWCFSQLKDAALLTLDVATTALEHGMVLKDASAYNVQFTGCRPVFIDTLSFARYDGGPWPAYRQFCQHFLAPLALATCRDDRLCGLLQRHIDGIPLDLAARLLPWKTRLSPSLLMHIHVHARMQDKYSEGNDPAAAAGKHRAGRLQASQLKNMIDGLRHKIAKLEWQPGQTTWSHYYSDTNYSDNGLEAKAGIVDELLGKIPDRLDLIQDLGANTGRFSHIAAARGYTLACDLDSATVDANYRNLRAPERTTSGENILPLVLDLTNPSPSLGWAGRERDGFFRRARADAVLALALVHHLAIANNLPLPQIAEFFADAGRWLIIEFVPKTDSQVQRLLASRQDIFPDYTSAGFEQAFGAYFDIKCRRPVPDSQRILYLMAAR